MERIENRTFEELRQGDVASLVRTLTRKDLELFALALGKVDSTSVQAEFAESEQFHQLAMQGHVGRGALKSCRPI
jgi:hypothetical protein